MDKDIKLSCVEFLKAVIENEDQDKMDEEVAVISRHVDICLNLIKHTSDASFEMSNQEYKRSNIPFRWG